jgi:hypothetical protein
MYVWPAHCIFTNMYIQSHVCTHIQHTPRQVWIHTNIHAHASTYVRIPYSHRQSHRHANIPTCILLYGTYIHACIRTYTMVCLSNKTPSCKYWYICTYIFTHTQNAQDERPDGHKCMTKQFIYSYMPDATTSSVCPSIQLRRTQLAIHTLPAITNTPHMHSKPSATCHYSQILKRREALEHARRQRRDLVVIKIPAQAHTQGEGGEAAASRSRAVHLDALRMQERLVASGLQARRICMLPRYVICT